MTEVNLLRQLKTYCTKAHRARVKDQNERSAGSFAAYIHARNSVERFCEELDGQQKLFPPEEEIPIKPTNTESKRP